MKINEIGNTYGRLTVVAEASGPKRKRAYWLCQCVCGKTSVVMGKYLRNGDTISCGCRRIETLDGTGNITHGHTMGGKWNPTYHTWSSMVQRCTNTKSTGWYKYGAKGTRVCERWLVYDNFLADLGERPVGKTLDRIDNNGNYEPGNCRWATAEEQMSNTSRNRYITYEGETMTLSQWARKEGVSASAMHSRMARNGGPFRVRQKRVNDKPPPFGEEVMFDMDEET